MRFSFGSLLAIAFATASAFGCATTNVDAPAVVPPKAVRTQVKQAPAVPAFHWEPLDVSVDPSIERAPLPLEREAVTSLGRAGERIAAWPEAARDALYARGFVVLERRDAPSTVSDFYRDLEEREVPLVLTVDALAEVAHVAIEAALSSVDAVAIEPTVRSLLLRFAKRFEALTVDTPTDLQRPLRMARGIVAVALSLLDDTPAPADLAADVRDETRRVREGFAPTTSLLLGLPIDYRAIGAVSHGAARRKVADAAGWLAAAPLLLLGRDGERNAKLSVSLARDHARAALLFAHATHPKVDPDAGREMTRVEALETFLVGAADDWSPPELAELAMREGFDLTRPSGFVDVARIDRLRRNAATSYRARVNDGNGSLAAMASELTREEREHKFVSRFVVGTARVFGARVALDAIVQQALVSPVVGRFRGDRTVVTLREGRRVLSRPLDFMAVLGSDEARVALRTEGDDAYDDFDATLRKLVARKPPELEATRHASVYLSALDAVGSLLAPSAADASLPASGHPEYRKRMLEAALAAYVDVRHDFGRRARALPQALGPAEGSPRTEGKPRAPRIFVEPHPEAIGRMVALVRQASRGLTAYRAIDTDAPGAKVVAAAERLLTTSFQVALLMANGLAPNEEQTRALAEWTQTMSALERATDNRAARAIDMHIDLAGGRTLMQGTGRLAEIALVVRDPRDATLTLAFGASATHHELVHAREEQISDREWRERVARDALPRAAWTNGYRVTSDQK